MSHELILQQQGKMAIETALACAISCGEIVDIDQETSTSVSPQFMFQVSSRGICIGAGVSYTRKEIRRYTVRDKL